MLAQRFSPASLVAIGIGSDVCFTEGFADVINAEVGVARSRWSDDDDLMTTSMVLFS